MTEHLTAKDIQDRLGISKDRYVSIMRQVGIKPEYKEVEGTGKAHQWSVKNLVQFAIAQRALHFLTAKQAGRLLDHIENNYEELIPNLYEPELTYAYIYFAELTDGEYAFYIESIDPETGNVKTDIDMSEEAARLEEKWLSNLKGKHSRGIKFALQRRGGGRASAMLQARQYHHYMMNLGKIKHDALMGKFM